MLFQQTCGQLVHQLWMLSEISVDVGAEATAHTVVAQDGLGHIATLAVAEEATLSLQDNARYLAPFEQRVAIV